MHPRTAWICVLAASVAGCAKPPSTRDLDPSGHRLQLIRNAWFAARMAPHSLPPRSWDDIARFIDDDDPESVRVSPSDGMPYVIAWEARLPNLQAPAHDGAGRTTVAAFPILAYEQRGRDGSRAVVNVLGQVRRLSEEELKATLRPTTHTRAAERTAVARH